MDTPERLAKPRPGWCMRHACIREHSTSSFRREEPALTLRHSRTLGLFSPAGVDRVENRKIGVKCEDWVFSSTGEHHCST